MTTDHDPLCHASGIPGRDPECCDCDLIARVRADEREREAAVLAALTRWKAEATAVIKAWEQVHGLLGSPGQIGESKASATYDRVVALLGGESE